jgi:hypothetical protein
MHLKLEAQILTPLIRTKVLDFPIELIFNLILKFLELFKISDICFIKWIYPYLLKSSVKVIK